MERLTWKTFALIVFMPLAVLVTATNAPAAQYRVFEYFEGLASDYREEGWQGYNYHAGDLIDGNTKITLYGDPKWDAEGQPYTCIGWKDASGSITPQSGVINRVEFTLNADSSITWIYRKAHKMTFDVSGMDQSLSAWGSNDNGQLGLGDTSNRNKPTPVGPDSPWVSVASGTAHTVALDADGNLWAWGWDQYGQLGDGTTASKQRPVRVQEPLGDHGVWVSVAAGYAHTLAIKSDGTLWAWGHNGYGQLGNGPADLNAHPTPEQVGSDDHWKAVAAGRIHSLALKEDGTLWACGSNAKGQYGNNNTTTTGILVPAGLDANGDPMAWVAVAAGEYHTVAINLDGDTLWTWGDNQQGQLGIGQADTSAHPTPEQVGTGSAWSSVAAGVNHTMAIRQDGTLWAWGYSYHGSLGIDPGAAPAGWTRNPANGHEYALTGQMNWTSAEAYAVSQGAHLATVNDKAEHDWIRSNLGTDRYWIGLYDNTGNFDWRWISGEPVSWTYWASGEPNYKGDEKYVEMNYPSDIDGRWNNYMGTNLLKGLMERVPVTPVPTQVTADLDRDGQPDSDWSFVAAGQDHTLAVKTDGTLWAWGNPDQGRLGWAYNGTTGHLYTLSDHMPWWAAEATAVSFGGHLVTVNDQTEQNWLVSIFGGEERFWIGLNDGNIEGTWVYASFETSLFLNWYSGEPSDGGVHGEDYVEMNWRAPGRWNDHQGSVFKRGIIERSADAWEPVQVGADAHWTAVAAGGDHTVALKQDGSLWAFGDNESGQLGFPTPDLSPEDGKMDPVMFPTQVWSSYNVVTMAAGEYHTLALKADGSLWAWGLGTSGQLGLGDNINRDYPTHVQPGITWSAVAAGYRHTLAIKSDGTLWGWGRNYDGQLGLGDTTDRSTPTQVGEDDKWIAVYVAGKQSFGLKSDGTLWAWGFNLYGQLGLGTNSNNNTPTQVQPGTTWQTVAVGYQHTVGIESDGTLWAWGYNEYGQLGLGHNGNKWTPTPVVFGPPATWMAVAAGFRHTAAIRSDGTLWAWGYDEFGQLGLGDSSDRNTAFQVGTDNDWISVAAGGYHTLAVKSDGTLWIWGRNHYGQLGLEDYQNRYTPTRVGSETNWISIAEGAEWAGNHSLAIRGLNRLELEPHMGPKFVTEGTEVNASAKVIPSDGQGAPYNLTSFTSIPATYGSSFIVESGVDFTWTFEEARAIDVAFDPGVPESVQNASGAFPAQGESRFVEGAEVTLQVDPVVTDPDGTVYVCTGWTGTGQVPASGDAASVTVSSLDQNSSITWLYTEARSLTTEFDGLPEHLQNEHSAAFIPTGRNSGRDPNGPVWMPRGSDPQLEQTLQIPTEIYDEGGRVRYTLKLEESSADGDLDKDNDHKPDGATITFNVSGDSTVTWVYQKELRLRINVVLDRSKVGNPDDSAVINATDPGVNYKGDVSTADTLPWDTYYKDDPDSPQPVSVTLSIQDHPVINGYTLMFRHLNVLSGDAPVTAPQKVGDVMQGAVQLTQPTELVWDYENAQRLFIGRAITPPTGADGNVAPQIEVDPPLIAAEAFFWDGNNKQLYPVRPLASATLTWRNATEGGTDIERPVYAVWPSYATLRTWGQNDYGQLGDGTTTSKDAPLAIGSDNDWKTVIVGEYHTLALKTDGTLWAWGANDHGQLGFPTLDSDNDGNMDPALVPTQVGTDTDWTAVAAGGYHTLSLKTDGTLWVWGANDHGQLGFPTPDSDQDGYMDPALTPMQVGTDTDWISIAAGKSHSLAIKTNKTLYGWGLNDSGELGMGASGDILVPTFSAPGPWQTVTAGSYHTLALKEDGTLFAWGYDVGQVGTSSGTTGWVSVAAGDAHSLGIKKDGTLWTWGNNNNGQLGFQTPDSDNDNYMDSVNTPTQIGTDTDWLAVAGGFRHSVAVRAGGTLWAWGANANGQLGLGDTINRSVPTRVGTNIYWSAVAAGRLHTLALKSTIQKHIVQAPARLEPAGGQYSFEKLHYSECYEDPDTGQYVDPNIPVDNPEFNPPNPGRSLLRFSGGTPDPPLFVVVNSVRWDDEMVEDLPVDIGKDIRSPKDQNDQDLHQDPEGKNGYVFFENSYYDGIGDDSAYSRSTRGGQIIPVNETTASTAPDRQMVVVWYETGAAGVGWPVRPMRYLCGWPANPAKIIIASGNGSEDLSEYEYLGKIYYQPDPAQPGYNPNEEHALLLGNKVFALRNDLNTYLQDGGTWVGPFAANQETTSEPYVLLKYWNADTESWVMKVFKVEATDADYDFSYPITAGSPILPLMPMDVLPKPQDSYMATGDEWHYRDHKGGHWAKASGQNATITMHWYYPLQSGFYYPLPKADGSPVGAGDPIPFLNGGHSHQAPPRDVTYVVSWPGDVKTLNIGETLTEAKYGLPDIVNWAAGQIIFDESVHNGGGSLAKLIDPYTERAVPLNTLPDSIRTENLEGQLRFPDLPYALRSRLFYDPTNEKLIFKGISYDPGIGEPLLLPNIMTARERDLLETFEPYWRSAVEDLFWETRNALVGSQKLVGVPMALTAGAAADEGYMVLAENDDESLEAAPVALHVIRVADGPYRGEIKVIKPDNVFDEKLTLRHSGDFGGEPERLYFAWYYKPDNSGLPPELPQVSADTNGWVLFDEGPGMIDITIEGAGKLTLSDNWFMVHYYYGDHPEVETEPAGFPALAKNADPNLTAYWSDWAGAPGGQTAQLAPGWIKRVAADLNPLDARVKDFRNYEVSTDVSVITQIGERYEGDIALSGAPENLNNLGLIEAYETVLNRAEDFSIDASPPTDYGPVNNAILNAGTRIADFYTLLGNEAYRDALDPTIGFDTQSGALGTMASSIFAFQNQLSSLLEEELVLLRGRDDTMSTTRARPVYNRLVWNFTQGDGELAYVQTYNIRDMDKSGVVDELDAKDMYPQGHGDAWGHYLTAMKVWYGLLRHADFTWEPRIESVLVGGAPIPVDYLDERKFAQTAAAKAKVGAEIVNLTYRRSYVEDPAGQWQGYKDTDTNRAWGVDGWARRAGQGAYFDWAVANAMLPEKDPVSTHTGIQKIDRSTVPELAGIASEFFDIQTQADRADRGLNPLGLAKGVVPFDIEPILLRPDPYWEAKTHFEQIYERALGALGNARTLFDYATQYTLMLRQNEDTLVDFRRRIEDQERNYTNRLIEIFGYPYEGDMGPGRTYKAGYIGPDLFHFLYMDLPDLTGEELMGEQVAFTYTFDFDDMAFDKDGDALLKGLNVTVETDPETGQKTTGTEITYHIGEDSPWIPRPAGWGKRRAPGEIQMALSELIKDHADYSRGLTELDGLLAKIRAAVEVLEAKHGIIAHQIAVKSEAAGDIKDLNEEMAALATAQKVLARVAGEIDRWVDGVKMIEPAVITGAIAGIFGGAVTLVETPRVMSAAAQTVKKAVLTALSIAQDGLSIAQLWKGVEKEHTAMDRDKKLFIDDARFEVQQMVKELEYMEADVRAKLQELYGLREVILQSAGRFDAALAEGERLLTEREVFRKRAAADIQDYRYQDIGFRTFRNDAVEKYRATFELAARYAYLAATAYDYETNLLGSEIGSGRAFLTDIVKQRSPGVITGGKPVVGKRGLADPLARLSQNFEVYKGQLGFNNPQSETNRFSLRRELFRFKEDQASDLVWRAELENYVVDNLWNFPPFRRFCRPFADESIGDQPGLVIPFSTEVNFGYNFFGWPLGAQDSAYDPSNFATKIRSVGVWFKGYETAGLSSTPRVYLVPVGADVLRTPDGDDFATREWYVVDQKLPVPFPLSDAELAEETWIPVYDSLSDVLGEIRRFSSFRAYPDPQELSENEAIATETTTDSRLVGRSVWNTQWLIIIPGGTLLADPEAGLDAFIDNVTDIKLFFQTYAFSGN